MVQPLELHEMNSLEFFNKLRMPDDEFEEWMANLGLLHSAMLCKNCHQPMHDKMHGRNRKWICERQGCRFGPSSKDKPEKGFLSVCFGFFHLHYFRARFFPTRSQVESRLNQSCTFRIYGLIALAHWSRQNLKLK